MHKTDVSAPHVVVRAEEVHALHHLVAVDQGPDNDDDAQDAPAPEGAGAEFIGNTPAQQLIADAVGNAVIPHQRRNAQGQPAEDEGQQQEVHGRLPVIGGGDGVDVLGDGIHDTEPVDAQGDDAQEDHLQHEQPSQTISFQFRVFRLL